MAIKIDFMNRENTNYARGISILMILVCHVAAVMLSQSIARLMTPLGGIGVAVFLVISGYGNNESYLKRGTSDFWKKKLLGVIVPYVVAFLVYQAVVGLFLNFKGLIRTFFTIDSTYYWYIGYQIFWYFVFYFAVRLKKSLSFKYSILVTAAGLSFVLFNEIRAEQSFSFLLGVLLSDFKEIKAKVQNIFVVVSMLIIGIASLAIKQLSFVRSASGLLIHLVQLCIKLPLGIFILIFVGWIMSFSFMRIFKKFFTISGNYSYEIYLAHSACIGLIPMISSKWLGVLAFSVATVILSLLLHTVSRTINKQKIGQ